MFEDMMELEDSNNVLKLLATVVVVSAFSIGAYIMKCRSKSSPAPILQGGSSVAQQVVEHELQASLLALTFNITTQVSERGQLVPSPHWTSVENRSNPAVFIQAEVAGATLKARIRIDRSVNQPALGTLGANFGTLTLQCDNCPLQEGIHDVDVRIVNLQGIISHIVGSPSWSLTSKVSSCPLATTPLELFVILNHPGKAFEGEGAVWVEALRFLCDDVKGLVGSADAHTATKLITHYCHSQHSLTYESVNHYTYHTSGGRFCLDAFMRKTDKYANCYDQAGAVQVLSHAIGSYVDYHYANTYGFINTTNLMGVANCNNPGYGAIKGAPKYIAANSDARTGFCDHAFCTLKDVVFDACVGPHLGMLSIADYLNAAIDQSDAAVELCRMKRDGYPDANATLANVSTGGVTILDRGLAGQVLRRELMSEIKKQGFEDAIIGDISAFKLLINKELSSGVTPVAVLSARDAPIIEQQLEEILVSGIGKRDAAAAVAALDRDRVRAMTLDHLNTAYGTKVTQTDLQKQGKELDKADEKKAVEKENRARDKQIESRKLVVKDKMMTVKEFDEMEISLGREVFRYDPKTLEAI